jgi:GNAT superfamily N-acetyltransferase
VQLPQRKQVCYTIVAEKLCLASISAWRFRAARARSDKKREAGPMSLHVRPLEARDHAAWIRLFKGYIEFYKATVAEDVIATTWERLINREPGSPVGLVAVDETDVPLGLAHVLFHRSTWSATWYCYLEDLFVDPLRRKAGAGRALIEAVYREADARGCTRTYWMTQEFNDTARALYDQVATKAPFVQYRR